MKGKSRVGKLQKIYFSEIAVIFLKKIKNIIKLRKKIRTNLFSILNICNFPTLDFTNTPLRYYARYDCVSSKKIL